MSSASMSRMSGAGNTFLVWDTKLYASPTEARSGVARMMCDGYTGFYTDGMFFIEPDAKGEVDFQWDFYNSDGSHAEMCGNAARCAALYYFRKREAKKEIQFRTAAGVVRAKIIDHETVEVEMPMNANEGTFLALQIGKKKIEHFFINTGVPHLIVEGEPNADIAKILRHAPELGSAGANVTFITEIAPGEIEAVTYERGVENFTLACGTGAVAAAAFSKLRNPLLKTHTIEMPGGSLAVDYQHQKPILRGQAQFEFDLILPEDA